MASVLDLVKHYQHNIEKYPLDEQKVLKYIEKLFRLDVTVQHLQETGVGRTVNALRKEPGDVGPAARALVYKWKLMVAAEESDQEGDHNDSTTHNGTGHGRESDDSNNQSQSRHNQHQSSKSGPKSDQKDKQMNGDYSRSKRKYQSSEEEEPEVKKSKYSSSSETEDHRRKHDKIQSEPSESDSQGSDESQTEESDSELSESSEEEQKATRKIKIEPPEKHKSPVKDSTLSQELVEVKKESSSSKKTYSSSDNHSRHLSSESKHSDKLSSKDKSHSSHKDKSSKDTEGSFEKKHRSDHKSTEKEKSSKEVKSSSKHSSEKHKSSSQKSDSSSEKHKSQSDKNKSDKHSSSQKSEKDKNKSSSDKDVYNDKHKSKEGHSSSSKDKSSSSKDKSKDRSSSSKEKSSSHKSDKKHSSSNDKSKNSDSKIKVDKSEDKSTEMKKSSHRSSSSSSLKSKSSSSKSKDDIPKKKSNINGDVSDDDGIDCGSGASFADVLGMIVPTKSKKKSTPVKDAFSPNNTSSTDLSPAALLAPTAKLAPLPALEISALPEISPNYKPRPPPKFLPHFSDEDAMSAVISSKNQRTKVYSGNKVLGKIPTLYEMCVQILQEHIDALEYTGGVPYEILKPVVDKATPNQLFMLEHHNPYLMDDTDHLWQKHCEKHFRNKRRQEMETWRDMYLRCQEEQEHRLKSLTENIRLTQEAKKAPIKQTKMAYVDSVVKPPRNIARKQALHGTAHTASASPAARVAALAKTSNVLKGGSIRPPPAAPVSASSFTKPKKAPLMAKALQFMRGRKR